MKIQDLAFLVVLLILLVLKRPRLSVLAGLIFLVLSMPLFSFWIFFTAERLTWYSAGYFFLAIIQYFFIVILSPDVTSGRRIPSKKGIANS